MSGPYPSYRIVPATRRDVAMLARTINPEDRLEIAASGFDSPRQALLTSFEASAIARAAVTDTKQVLFLWGVAPECLLTGRGIIWGHGSPLVRTMPRRFVAESRAQVAELGRLFPVLHNAVDTRYAAACRWLERIGFRPGRTFEQNGVTFRDYERNAEETAAWAL